MLSDDSDDGGIVAVRRRAPPPVIAPSPVSSPAPVAARPAPLAASSPSAAQRKPASAATPSRSPSGASGASAAAATAVALAAASLPVRTPDGWYSFRVGRVKHAAAGRAAVAATHLPADTRDTQAATSATLDTHDNAVIIPAPAIQAMGAHAGQVVWIRSVGVETTASTWFALARLWPADTKAARLGGPRVFLPSHSTSPLADGVSFEVRVLESAVRRAKSVHLRRSLVASTSTDPRLDRLLASTAAATLDTRHVYVGMSVCMTLFDEEHALVVDAVETDEELPRHNAVTDDLATQLDRLALQTTDNAHARVASIGSSAVCAVPCVALVCGDTRVRLVSSVASSSLASAVPPSTVIDCDAIGGLESEIGALRDLLTLPLLQPELFSSFGLKPPKGVLLHGPPGTGKTMIARAVAQQAFASFYVVNGPEIISKHVGESEEKLVSLFATARATAPSIIFLDEIDSLCPKRDESTDEMQKRIVAALLTLMDGLSTSTGGGDGGGSGGAAEATSGDRVVVIGATNRPDALDTAMRRAGRFDREIEIGIPNETKRRDILQRMLRNMPHTLTTNEVHQVASVTHGYVGADLKALCREAALVALDRWQRAHPEWAASLASSPSSLALTAGDFLSALPGVKPSAMRSLVVDVPRVSWTDIGGQEDVKQQLKEAVEWPLQHPEAFLRLGIQPPKGILLYGPPGCSKTLMAKALASESSRNFIAVKGPELFSKYVGESEKAVREIFRKARAAAPAIIFFDEIDSIAAKRADGAGGGDGGGERVAHRVLSQLLSELDGIEPLRQVTVLAATNRPDMIDAALLRPGRIDRMLYVSPPDADSCAAILRIEFRRIGAAVADVDASLVAPHCVGLSGAEIAALCREAALVAMEADVRATRLTYEHFLAARARITPRITPEMRRFYDEYREKTKRANA